MMDLRGSKSLCLLALREFEPLQRLMEPLRSAPLLLDAAAWDRDYESGKWRFLSSLAEEAHNLIIGSYANGFRGAGRILDVGCGEGALVLVLRRFGYARYLGIDISSTAVQSAARLSDANTAFQVVSEGGLETDERFDVIIFNETLYYFADPVRIIERYSSLLAPEGVFVISMALIGIRDGLLKLRIWRELKRRVVVIDETTIYRRTPASWVIRVLAVPETEPRLAARLRASR